MESSKENHLSTYRYTLLPMLAAVALLPASLPAVAAPDTSTSPTAQQHAKSNRAVVSIRSGDGNFVSWRLLGSDPTSIAFDVYRDGTKVTSKPLTSSTSFFDKGAPAGANYTVVPVGKNVTANAESKARVFQADHIDIPLQIPEGGSTPDGEQYTYSANDASVGDLDGDGEYEYVVKWDPSNAKDSSQSGYTGNQIVDAYKTDGTLLWRIDLGVNIRAGAHYTQFQVYDYNGDGKAEVAMKTADGTVDGEGTVIGDAEADYRDESGTVLSGPEFLTMFDGATGAALNTVDYAPARGNVADWGDDYGNRSERYLAATAHIGGQPALIEARGYYAKTALTAWRFSGGKLTQLWSFDSSEAGTEYEGQGNHNLSVADVDGDGNDEIIYGAMAIDDNGQPLWNTGYGHGDAMHVGDLAPADEGLEVFKVSEDSSQPGSWLADAGTGEIIWETPACCDNGRGVAADIWADSPGAEFWSSAEGDQMLNPAGEGVGIKPESMNFLVWWDGDRVRELLDDTYVDKYVGDGTERIQDFTGVVSNNGTKATPSLSADLMGDWREEVVFPTEDSSALRVFSTTAPTDVRLPSLMEDRQYRLAVAWQNSGYNQPPHPSYFIGAGMEAAPRSKNGPLP